VFTKQDPMRRVVYSLVPIFLWSVYLYGWRVVALAGFVFLLGVLAEYVFEKSRNKKVTEAVLVTSALFALSMPPAVPFWVAGVGIIFAVIFGKEVYGGFGKNLFNPAITGRTFTYISFPLMMQTTWMFPGSFGMTHMNSQVGGSVFLEALFMLALVAVLFWLIKKTEAKKPLLFWLLGGGVLVTIAFYLTISYTGLRVPEIDTMATATPIEIFKGLAVANNWSQPVNLFGIPMGNLEDNNWLNLFLGLRIGSIGEGAIFLILLAAVYLIATKTANWRPIVMTMVSALVLTGIFYWTGALKANLPLLSPDGKDLGTQILDILRFSMSGSLIFVAVFMATDPVSAPKKTAALYIYGILIGSITIVIRGFSGFPEGVSFAILTANAFASLIDELLPAKKKKAPAAKPGAAPAAPVTKEAAE